MMCNDIQTLKHVISHPSQSTLKKDQIIYVGLKGRRLFVFCFQGNNYRRVHYIIVSAYENLPL